MKYKSIRMHVDDEFIELCRKNNLKVSPISCFSADTTLASIFGFLYEAKDVSILAVLAYVVVEWLKVRNGKKIKVTYEDKKIKTISAENITTEELEALLSRAVHLEAKDPGGDIQLYVTKEDKH